MAGENDFLQTVINKVIAAKEVNHKGQGRYFALLYTVSIRNVIPPILSDNFDMILKGID